MRIIIFLAFVSLLDAQGSAIVSDDVLFQLNWPGASVSLPDLSGNILVMKTADNEQYQCHLPSDETNQRGDFIRYSGISARSLIESLLKKQTCTMRMEPYWNYELCHGKHIRQYHEEKLPGKGVKSQEYFLGKGYNFTDSPENTVEKSESIADNRENLKIPTILIQEKEHPFVEVVMNNGTPCDLKSGKPRLSRVRYICDENGRNEMIVQEETSTCEYQIVIACPLLCKHPLYQLKRAPVNMISCHPLNGAPVRPLGMQKLEEPQQKQYKAPIKTLVTGDEEDVVETPTPSKSSDIPETIKSFPTHVKDDQLTKDFLNGKHCLEGGRGWWKFQFCYGKFAKQFHQEKNSKTEIVLGTWNEEAHKAWWRSRKLSHSPTNLQVTHMYTNGDKCDLTGRPRQVQVRLKCKPDLSHSAVTLYLIEPSSCNYILGVESSILCPLLKTANEFGLFNPPP